MNPISNPPSGYEPRAPITPETPAGLPLPVPVVTDLKRVLKHSDFQSLQPVVRPAHWGVDLEPMRRPGTPKERTEPRAFPNTIYPPERQDGESAVPLHGRSNRAMPPVFGTATPLHGVSGWIRRIAYRLPDHKPSHWLIKMAADRVEEWGHNGWRYALVAAPLLAAAAFPILRGPQTRKVLKRVSRLLRQKLLNR